jgi:hypothetical protein
LGIGVLAGLGVCSYLDPNLKLPVISPLVCSLKGGVFYDEPVTAFGAVVQPPGCYSRDQPSAGSKSSPTGPIPSGATGDAGWYPLANVYDPNHDAVWTFGECRQVGGTWDDATFLPSWRRWAPSGQTCYPLNHDPDWTPSG